MKSINLKLNDDLTQFYLPSFIFLIAFSIPNFLNFPFITFFVFIILDIGHAYSTLLRTYLQKNKPNDKPVLIPTLFFFGAFLYCYLGLPNFWTCIIYFTFFHHMRQNYGVFRWYAYLDKYKNKWDEISIQLLAIVPFIIFHMRDITYIPLYHHSELINLSNGSNFNYFFFFYTLYFFYSTIRILKKLLNREISEGTSISFIYPSALNYICFMFFENSFQVFMPLLVLHSTTYLSLINKSARILEGQKYNQGKTWLKIVLIITIFSIGEQMLTDTFHIFSDSTSFRGKLVISLIASISVFPNLMHYYLDAKIWKKDNADFKKIISSV
jgi:hypothetical protein